MADFDEIKTLVICRLHDHVVDTESVYELSRKEIEVLAADIAAPLVCRSVLEELQSEGLIRSTGAKIVSRIRRQHNDVRYQITPDFFRVAETIKRTALMDDGKQPAPNSALTFSYILFKKELLVAWMQYENAFGPGIWEARDIADWANLKYKPGWVRKAAISFRDDGYIKEAFSKGDSEDANHHGKLTGEGLEMAEALLSESPHSYSKIPASDRVVTLDHNQQAFRDMTEKFEAAREAIASLNSPAGYDQEQVIGELSAAKKLLKSAKVRLIAVTTIVLSPLVTVYHDAAAAALMPMVLAAITSIRAYFGI